jgi:hypothetical protein
MRLRGLSLFSAAVLSLVLAACSTQAPVAGSCQPLLQGRGFEGYLLVEQEPGGSGTERMLCSFVPADARKAPAGSEVPSREVVYDTRAETLTERPGSQRASAVWGDAPQAR